VALPPVGETGEYSVPPDLDELQPGQLVVIEGVRGRALGEVRSLPQLPKPKGGGRIRRVLRRANEADLRCQREAELREEEAFRSALQLLRAQGLDWRLVAVHADGIGNTMSLCIAADERQDVKAFAKDLGRRLGMKTLIRQVGRRDSARIMQGLGRCGREFCCSTFLKDYPATSIRSAKDQHLALSPDKTQGQCGGTLCCLAYEHGDYLERGEWLPKVGKKARTLDGVDGRVVAVNALKMTFTLVDARRRRHVLPADSWEGNRGKDVPAPDAQPASVEEPAELRPGASPNGGALAQSAARGKEPHPEKQR